MSNKPTKAFSYNDFTEIVAQMDNDDPDAASNALEKINEAFYASHCRAIAATEVDVDLIRAKIFAAIPDLTGDGENLVGEVIANLSRLGLLRSGREQEWRDITPPTADQDLRELNSGVSFNISTDGGRDAG